MQAQLEFYEDLEGQCDEAKNRLQRLKQELESYDALMSLLKNHINENINMQQRSASIKDDDRKLSILKESFDKLQAKFERFRSLKIDREYDYQRQLTEKTQLENHLNSMKTQIAAIRKQQQQDETDRTSQTQDPAFDYDVETINFLNECNWNLGNSCDRGLAETLLSCFPSGTFLVRSSKSKDDSFVLSVVANAKVRHCLIDKIGEEYCFHPPGPQRQTYSSLCDLVMDYRHISLVKHNPELNTSLIYPVLSQLKKVGR